MLRETADVNLELTGENVIVGVFAGGYDREELEDIHEQLADRLPAGSLEERAVHVRSSQRVPPAADQVNRSHAALSHA